MSSTTRERSAGGRAALADGGQDPVGRRPAHWAYQLVIALALATAGAGLLVLDEHRGAASGGNRALLDTDATTKVAGDVSNALTRIFSYTPDDTATAERAAAQTLAGEAAADYRRLFAKVRSQAPEQRLALTTRVVRAGVSSLTGDTARLLVFLDQTATRDGRPNGTPAAAQLSVTARLTGGRWRITVLRSS